MPTMTLGGRSFEIRPLKIREAMAEPFASMLEGLGESAPRLGAAVNVVAAYLVAVGAEPTMDAAVNWLQDLPAGEVGAVAQAATVIMRESGFSKDATPGEPGAPATR